jgi:hypothetical protein
MMVRKRGDWLIAKVGDEHVMMNRQKVHHISASPRLADWFKRARLALRLSRTFRRPTSTIAATMDSKIGRASRS